MAWIESHQELASHPKTRRLASSLGVSVPTAIGHLHLLWWWALDYAEEGELAGLEPDEIAYGAQWDGDPQQFMAALTRSGFIDEDLTIHDWWQYAGRYVSDKQKNAKRMRERRAREKAEREADAAREDDDGGTYKERAPHVQSTSPARAPATVPNLTVPNLTVPNLTNSAESPSRVDAREAHRAVALARGENEDEVDVLYHQLEPLAEHDNNAEAQRRLYQTCKDVVAGKKADVTLQNAVSIVREWQSVRRPNIDTPTGRATSLTFYLDGYAKKRDGPTNGHSPPREPTLRAVTPEEIAAAEFRFGRTDGD